MQRGRNEGGIESKVKRGEREGREGQRAGWRE